MWLRFKSVIIILIVLSVFSFTSLNNHVLGANIIAIQNTKSNSEIYFNKSIEIGALDNYNISITLVNSNETITIETICYTCTINIFVYSNKSAFSLIKNNTGSFVTSNKFLLVGLYNRSNSNDDVFLSHSGIWYITLQNSGMNVKYVNAIIKQKIVKSSSLDFEGFLVLGLLPIIRILKRKKRN